MGRPALWKLCAKAKSLGYDGLELACWGDHFDVDQAARDDKTTARTSWEICSQATA